MLAAEHVARGAVGGPRQRRARELRRGLARRRHRPRPLEGAQRQAAVVEARHVRSASPLGGLDMWTNTLGFSLFGTLGHGKPDSATLKPAARMPADRLSEARRQAHLRPAVLGVSVQHQSRGRPAAAPAWSPTWRCRRRPSTTSMPGRRRAIARPASTNGSRRAAQPRFVINAQNCVHCKTCDIKDPNQQHHLGAAGGRRRAELFRICDCAVADVRRWPL